MRSPLPTPSRRAWPTFWICTPAETLTRPLEADRLNRGLQVPPRWMLSFLGAFVPVLRENMELYQFEHDYRFDSGLDSRGFAFGPAVERRPA